MLNLQGQISTVFKITQFIFHLKPISLQEIGLEFRDEAEC